MLKIEFKNSLEDISKILESENAQEKIRILETLHETNNLKILQQVISRLNDNSIQVRGEAFNSLLLNQNDILKFVSGAAHAQRRQQPPVSRRSRQRHPYSPGSSTGGCRCWRSALTVGVPTVREAPAGGVRR